VADFKSKLQQLSVRGTPVGAEELIERIEAELAGDPLVVTTKRREGVFMTKTDQQVTTKSPGPGRGLAWALAAFAVVLAIGGLYFAFRGDDSQVVDQTTVPTPTTVPVPEPEPTREGGMWPQSSLEEVEEAQERADAGDPDYTWQLAPNLESTLTNAEFGEQVETPEFIARFVREELGWDEFVLLVEDSGEADSQGLAVMAQLIRCEPGKSNPIWPSDEIAGGCAPTIDDFDYEAVEIHVAQPGMGGPEGIWVASAWNEVDFYQVAPLTDAEIAAIVEPFLQARIAGEGAEQYLGLLDSTPGCQPDTDCFHFETGFLYATSTGAPYERAEFKIADGPEWPIGDHLQLKVRLFADGGQTVVEQTFSLEGEGGQRPPSPGRYPLYHHQDDQSTENGQPLPKN
jgi:hypothetical protein